jgi:hypothetical protein
MLQLCSGIVGFLFYDYKSYYMSLIGGIYLRGNGAGTALLLSSSRPFQAFTISYLTEVFFFFFCFFILVLLRVPSREHTALFKIGPVEAQVEYYSAVVTREKKILEILKKNENKLKNEQAVYQLVCDNRLGRTNRIARKF